eukprot:m.128667 g.128667  ORF g.128667 m.128667 type:complete len:821 (-) comp9754_c0_seq1:37-2499(-)
MVSFGPELLLYAALLLVPLLLLLWRRSQQQVEAARGDTGSADYRETRRRLAEAAAQRKPAQPAAATAEKPAEEKKPEPKKKPEKAAAADSIPEVELVVGPASIDPTGQRPFTRGIGYDEAMRWSPGFDPYNVTSVPLTPRLHAVRKPKLLVCHDMMGGYVQDQHPQGGDLADVFRLEHWHLIDIFVYFSHTFLSIPPPVWGNCAHMNGTKILGTLITEWEKGEQICAQFLESEATVAALVEKLVDIAVYYNFDGWLVNIENPIPQAKITLLHKLVQSLTQQLHAARPGSIVIWYDSVTIYGQLRWQNELNHANKAFFDACDGIFLNYHWAPDSLKRSKLGHQRPQDVYVGIDVFGRGTFGGGGWTCNKALEEITAAGLSTALFAPGWLFENNPVQNFRENLKRFWKPFQAHFQSRPLARLPLHTTFCTGKGHHFSVDGHIVWEHEWANLSAQSILPSFDFGASDANPFFPTVVSREAFKDVSVSLSDKAAYDAGSSLMIDGTVVYDPKYVSGGARCVTRLFSTHFEMREPMCVSYTFKRTGAACIDMQLLLVMRHAANQPFQYIALGPQSSSREGYVPSSARDTQMLQQRFQLSPSPSIDLAEFRHLLPVSETFEEADGSSSEWITRNYVLCDKLYKHFVVAEVRTAVIVSSCGDVPSPVDPEGGDFSLHLGRLSIFSPTALKELKTVATVEDLRCSSTEWHRAGDEWLLSATLSWAPPASKECLYYDVFDLTRRVFLGRAYSNFFRVVKLRVHVEHKAQENATPAMLPTWLALNRNETKSCPALSAPSIVFALRPRTLAGLAPALDECPKIRVSWRPVP